MSPVIRYSVIGGALVAGTILALACSTDSHPTNARQLSRMEMDDAHTMGSGTSSKLLGRATFSDGEENLKIKRITGDWHVEIKAKEGISLAVQSITFFPEANRMTLPCTSAGAAPCIPSGRSATRAHCPAARS